ncbi:hypothetical protein SUGI_0695270 [Cryptomeria japonica]|nr:hypothetical protein SUGI_0695270 [Cryptomeria japonica]
MQSPIEVNLQLEPSIAFDTGEAICNNTLDNENVPLTEATPLIIIPPSSGQCKIQQDLLTLLEKTKTLQADIESKLADSLPPSPCVPRNQLVIEDGNLHSPDMETGTLREMGGQIYSSTGIELEDGEIETSASEGEEDFEPDSDLILEGTPKGFATLSLWLGSNVGNLTREDAVKNFKDVLKVVGFTSQLLVSMDMWRNPETLYSAYHDKKGETERFIKHGM